jgi:hypothetical protein
MTDIDTQITQLFAKVRKDRAELESLEAETKKSWVTNCSLPIDDQRPVNIQTASIAALRTAVASLLSHRDYHGKAAKELGVPLYEHVGSYTYDQWLTDCRKRVAVLSLLESKRKLDELEKRLDAIVSPEQRRAMELEALLKEIG